MTSAVSPLAVTGTGQRLPILITGVEGLVGRSLRPALERGGVPVRGLDLRSSATDERGDVADQEAVRAAVRGCRGIVHLAAVSRIAWAERDPAHASEVNVGGTVHVVRAALESPYRPWVVFASSREVYGSVGPVPVDEDAPLAPESHYAQTKAVGEALVEEAGKGGLRTAIVRFSNVYGDAEDHEDRVVPAFVGAAVGGRPLRVEGTGDYDFTHVRDLTRGLQSVIGRLENFEAVPTLHFVSGRSTSLLALARMVVELTRSVSKIEGGQARPFGASSFRGDPGRAARVLQWQARIPLEVGVRTLAEDYARGAAPANASSGDRRNVRVGA